MLTKYQRIARDLANQLTADSSRPEKLPTEQELCDRYHVSRQTVRSALRLLEQEGLIMRRQGSGSYPTGRSPKAGENRIAVLLPSDSDYMYPRLQNDLHKTLAAAGFDVSFFLTGYSVSNERKILMRLIYQPPAALVADPVNNALPNPNLDLYEKLRAQGVSVVFMQEAYDHFSAYSQIGTDSFGGTERLVSLLAEKAHTGIAGIFQQDIKSGPERYFGCARACIQADIPWDDQNVRWFSSQELLALQKKQATGFLRDFIRKNLGTCSGVIVQNDEIAYWLIKELALTGKHVPEDVAIASFDNSYLCDISSPRITSLAWEQGPAKAAAQLVLARLRGHQPGNVTLSYQLVRRESC